nr:phosphatidylinositol 3,4,5-trisphosphate 3-phosphatase TPTE2-like isoform X1 [Microcebus murinus]
MNTHSQAVENQEDLIEIITEAPVYESPNMGKPTEVALDGHSQPVENEGDVIEIITEAPVYESKNQEEVKEIITEAPLPESKNQEEVKEIITEAPLQESESDVEVTDVITKALLQKKTPRVVWGGESPESRRYLPTPSIVWQREYPTLRHYPATPSFAWKRISLDIDHQPPTPNFAWKRDSPDVNRQTLTPNFGWKRASPDMDRQPPTPNFGWKRASPDMDRQPPSPTISKNRVSSDIDRRPLSPTFSRNRVSSDFDRQSLSPTISWNRVSSDIYRQPPSPAFSWNSVSSDMDRRLPTPNFGWKRVSPDMDRQPSTSTTAWKRESPDIDRPPPPKINTWTEESSDLHHHPLAQEDELTEVVSEITLRHCAGQIALAKGTSHKATRETISEQLSRVESDEEDDADLNTSDRKIKTVRSILSSSVFRIFEVSLIILDIMLVITDLVVTPKIYTPLGYRSASLAIALFFFFALLLRLYVKRNYFSNAFSVLDAMVTVVSLMFNVVFIFFDTRFLSDIPRLADSLRLLRAIILIRLCHLVHQETPVEQLARRMASGYATQDTEGELHLDLTYVTERIIAVSYPTSRRHSFYGNSITGILWFLDSKHRNHYQVYHLCSQRYNPNHFHDRVTRIIIDNHSVPSLREMVAFSKDVHRWLAKDEKNVAVIHAQEGKGRTGTMVWVCLIARGLCSTAQDSFHHFGRRQIGKSISIKYEGVETPSQHRYVEYFEEVKRFNFWTLPPIKWLLLKKIIIYSIHGLGRGNGRDLAMEMIMKRKKVFSLSSSKNARIFHDSESNRVMIFPFNCPLLCEDVNMQFFIGSASLEQHKCQFSFWFHTSFINNSRFYLPRNELDKIHKPKTWENFPDDFAVEIQFRELKT